MAQVAGQVFEDLVGRVGLPGAGDQAVHLLHPAFEIGDRAFHLGEAQGGEHHVRPARRLGEEQVEGHHQVGALQSRAGPGRVGEVGRRIGAEQHQGPDAALFQAGEDPGGVVALTARQPVPAHLEGFPRGRVGQGHAAGEQVGRHPHVEGAVQVGAPDHRQHLGPREPLGEGGHRLGQARVFGQAGAAHDGHHRPVLQSGAGVGRVALPVGEAGQHRGTFAGPVAQEVGGHRVEAGAPGVDHHQAGPPHGGAPHLQVENGQFLLEVGPPQEDGPRRVQVVEGGAVGQAREEPGPQSVTEAGVEVVGAHRGAEELAEGVGLLVGAAAPRRGRQRRRRRCRR